MRHSSRGGLVSRHTGASVCEIKGISGVRGCLLHNFSRELQLHDRNVRDIQRLLITLSIDPVIHQGDMDPLTVLSAGHKTSGSDAQFVADDDI